MTVTEPALPPAPVAVPRRPTRRSRGSSGASAWTRRSLTGLFLALFAVFFGVPLVWVALAITKTQRQLADGNPFSFGSLSAIGDNFATLVDFQSGAFVQWLGNSTYYSVAALVLTLVTAIPAGYALGCMEFRLRRPLLVTTLVVMLLPTQALVLPIFLELNSVGLIGTPLAVILPFAFYPFGVYLAYIYFSTSIPVSILEAARLDGCSELRLFTTIALPLAKPIVALVGFFSFVQNWNNYFLPFVMLPSSDNYTVQVGLTSLLASTPSFNPSSAGADSIELPVLAMATVLSVLPVLIVFLFSQRFLVRGMTAGGVKE